MKKDMKITTYRSESCEETMRLARMLGEQLKPGSVVALFGELGAGKTRFVQGLAEALQVQDVVNSPTFTLVNEYRGIFPIYHMDLYRIQQEDEALDLGLDEYLYGEGVTVIEWSERIMNILPSSAWKVRITPAATETGRFIEVETPI